MNKNFKVKFVKIPREENKYADCLAKVASAECMTVYSQVLSFTQYLPAINDVDVHAIPIGIN